MCLRNTSLGEKQMESIWRLGKMAEESELQKNLRAMRGYLELAQLNSDLATSYLKDTANKLDICTEELDKAGIKLRIALENLGKVKGEILQ